MATGAADGLKLALNIGAMLLAFIAVIYAINWILVDFIGAFTGLMILLFKARMVSIKDFHYSTF
jgi:nucleoside permease NupC